MNQIDFIDTMAQVAHTYCTNNDHQYNQHVPTCTEYAKSLWGAGYSPEEIIKTIHKLGHVNGQWQGHPHPDQVLEDLMQ